MNTRHHVGADGAALLEEPRTLSELVTRNTPWWVISLMFHAAVLGLTMLIVLYVQVPPPTVFVIAPEPPPVDEPVLDTPPAVTVAAVQTEIPDEQTPFVEIETMDAPPDDSVEPSPTTGDNGQICGSFAGPAGADYLGIAGSGDSGRPGDGTGCNLPTGVPAHTEESLERALDWLARHQNEDGSWSAAGYASVCGDPTCASTGLRPGGGDIDVGLTGLALLSFLGRGYTHVSRDRIADRPIGEILRRGLTYLVDRQDAEGCIGARSGEYMYNHLIAALAVCEDYALTGSTQMYDAARLAVDFTIAARNPGRGWRYEARAGDNDTSVTGWAVMVLHSAELAGLDFDRAAYEGAMAWFESVLSESDNTTGSRTWEAGYQVPRDWPIAIRGVNDQYSHHPSMTAIWIMSEAFIRRQKTSRMEAGARAIVADLPARDDAEVDFYYWYYGSLAMWQVSGRGWDAWEAALVPALVDTQNRDSCARGSWEPVDRWSCRGGRVYATAINALTLEVYYRYENAFGTR